VKVDYVSKFFGDSLIGLWADNLYGGTFSFGVNEVFGPLGKRANIEPYVFHEYEVRTRDVRSYRFFVDGEFAWEGSFVWGGGGFTRYIVWGDGSSNYGVSHWDYVSFQIVSDARPISAHEKSYETGIAPEPATIVIVGTVLAVWPRVRAGILKFSK
jgi:hypothetical protein